MSFCLRFVTKYDFDCELKQCFKLFYFPKSRLIGLFQRSTILLLKECFLNSSLDSGTLFVGLQFETVLSTEERSVQSVHCDFVD